MIIYEIENSSAVHPILVAIEVCDKRGEWSYSGEARVVMPGDTYPAELHAGKRRAVVLELPA